MGKLHMNEVDIMQRYQERLNKDAEIEHQSDDILERVKEILEKD